MPAWPAAVPFLSRLADLSYSGPLGQLSKFQPDVGLPKIRRRTTASYRSLSGSTRPMSAVEFAAFEDFWKDDLAGGVLDFTATHPVTGATATFRPSGDTYEPVSVGAGKTRVQFSVFELPA